MIAQEEFTHYYLKIDGSEVEDFEIELGIVDYDKEYNPKQRNLKSITSLTQLNDAICTSFELIALRLLSNFLFPE